MYDVSSTGTVLKCLKGSIDLCLLLAWFGHHHLHHACSSSALIIAPVRQAGVAGALSGGSDTFLSNHKKNTWDAKLARITKWVSSIFMAAVLVLNLI